MVIENGRVFNDLPALKRWLQAFTVIRKRPYKVLHSYAERRYTVVCDKERRYMEGLCKVAKGHRKVEDHKSYRAT